MQKQDYRPEFKTLWTGIKGRMDRILFGCQLLQKRRAEPRDTPALCWIWNGLACWSVQGHLNWPFFPAGAAFTLYTQHSTQDLAVALVYVQSLALTRTLEGFHCWKQTLWKPALSFRSGSYLARTHLKSTITEQSSFLTWNRTEIKEPENKCIGRLKENEDNNFISNVVSKPESQLSSSRDSSFKTICRVKAFPC